jgi:prevent-host-death family protein
MAMTVNMHEAKTQLSRLVEKAERGEETIIARAGKPAARIVPIDQKPKKRKLGVLEGMGYKVPDDFNEMGREEIEKMFYGDE